MKLTIGKFFFRKRSISVLGVDRDDLLSLQMSPAVLNARSLSTLEGGVAGKRRATAATFGYKCALAFQ